MLRRRLTIGVGIVGLLVGVLAGLAGCGSAGGSRDGAGASGAGGGSARQQALPVWREFARCARANGVPDFPDPAVDDRGNAAFRPGTVSRQMKDRALSACGSILDRLPSSAQDNGVSAADLEHIRQFAGCLRQHGLPTWPDPKPDGSSPVVGTPLAGQLDSPQFQAADRACQRYWSGGVKAS
jgi:hypothetical protein